MQPHSNKDFEETLFAEESITVRFSKIGLWRFGFIITLLLHPLILVYIMDPSIYARFSYYTSLALSSYMVASLGLTYGMNRYLLKFIAQKRYHLLWWLIRYVLSWTLVMNLLMFLLLFLLYEFKPPLFDNKVVMLLIVGFGMFSLSINDWVYSLHYGLRQYYLWSFNFFLYGLLRILLVPLSYLLFGFEVALFAYGGSFFLSFIICLRLRPHLFSQLRSLTQSRPQLPTKELFGFSLPVYFSRMMRRFAHPMGVLILAFITSKTNPEIAFFHISVLAVAVLSLLMDSLLFSIYPELTKAVDHQDEQRKRELVSLAYKYLALFTVFAVATVICFIPFLRPLLPADYHQVILWLQIALLLLFLRIWNLPLVHLVQAQEKTLLYFKATLGWLFCYLSFYPLGAWLVGGWGVLAAYFIGEFILAVLLLWQLHTEINFREIATRNLAIILFFLLFLLCFLERDPLFRILYFASLALLYILTLRTLGIITISDLRRIKRLLNFRRLFALS